MNALSSISLSGMQAAQMRLDVSANNVANSMTEGFRRQTVEQQAQPGGGTTTTLGRAAQPGSSLEQDAVSQLMAKNDFLANLQVFRTSSQMTGSLIDIQA